MADYEARTDDGEKAEKPAKSTRTAKQWIAEIQMALRRESDFRKEGRDILSIYQGEESARTPFNILYSNTETLSPALYNQTPTPVVKRRYDDADPTAKQVASLIQRALKFLIDDTNPTETGFNEAMVDAVTQALLPGRGITRFAYDADVENDENDEPRKIKAETVCIYSIDWDSYVHGYAKKWRDVPWCAYKEPAMTKEEMTEMFGEAIAKEVPVKAPTASNAGSESTGTKDEGKRLAVPETSFVAEIWQIWDKASGMVYWVATDYPDKILKQQEPATKHRGFYPSPQPLHFFQRVGDLTPKALYSMYKSQAEEINLMTARIKGIIRACKVRGAYDSTISEMEKVLQSEENKLIPIPNATALYAQAGGLDRAIWLYPIEKLVSVLQALYQEREAAKQVLYEITGIADIMRGASVASETLGAQQIKAQWGTMRLKRMQAATAGYVRDCLRLMSEIVLSNFSPDTIQKMTNTMFLTQAQKAQVQQMQQATSAPPIPGQSPQQSPIPPEVAQAMSLPSLEEILTLVKNEVDQAYRIDIETNSTVDVEATEDKEQVSEAMNAIAQFFNGVGPLVQQGAMPMGVAKSILLSVVRRFRFGEEVEAAISQMPDQLPPQPGKEGAGAAPGPNPQVVAMQAQADQAKAQTDMLTEQAKQQTTKLRMAQEAAEHDFKMQEISAKTMQLHTSSQVTAVQHVQQMQVAAFKANNPSGQGGKGGASNGSGKKGG